MTLRDQLIRLLRRQGDNFEPSKWTVVFESDDGTTYQTTLADAIEYATATEAERSALLRNSGPFTRVSLRIRW